MTVQVESPGESASFQAVFGDFLPFSHLLPQELTFHQELILAPRWTVAHFFRLQLLSHFFPPLAIPILFVYTK